MVTKYSKDQENSKDSQTSAPPKNRGRRTRLALGIVDVVLRTWLAWRAIRK